MPARSRHTAREAAHYSYMADVMRRLEWDLHNTIAMTGRVPDAWHAIAAAEPHSARVKVSLWLEADVVKFLRSMGEGWGPRANDVLKSFMHARLAGVVRGAETLDVWKARADGFDGRKPGFGTTARGFGEADETVAPQMPPAREKLRQGLQARVMEEEGVKGVGPVL